MKIKVIVHNMNESQKYNIKKRKQIEKNQIILFYLYKVQKQAKLI